MHGAAQKIQVAVNLLCNFVAGEHANPGGGPEALAGTLVAPELSESDTTAPPLGAAPLKVTLPREEVPPVTLVGLRLNAESVGLGGGGGADGPTVSAAN